MNRPKPKTPLEKAIVRSAKTPVPPPKENPHKLPYPVLEGQVTFSGVVLRCYVLSDGRCIVSAADVREKIGGLPEPE